MPTIWFARFLCDKDISDFFDSEFTLLYLVTILAGAGISF
jgi:hypothetical protein